MKNFFQISLLRAGSEAGWVLGGQVGVALGGLISVKILTQLLSPFEYGRFAIANTIIVLVGLNIFGPLGQGVMRYWAIVQDRLALDEYIRVTSRYIKTLVFFSVLLSCLSGLIFMLVGRITWIFITVLALFCGAFLGWASVRISILMAARKRNYVSAINVLGAFAKPIVAGALIICWAGQAEIALLGFFIVACFSAWGGDHFFRRVAEKRRKELSESGSHSFDHLGKAIINFSKPFFIWGLFAWAHQSCDRWALLSFQGADTVGAYSVIAQLAFYPLVFASGFLGNFFTPIAYQRAGGLQSNTSIDSANKVLLTMVLIYIGGALLLIAIFYFFHYQLVLLISNEEYAGFSYLLPMLTAVWSLYYLGQMLSGFGMLVNKPNLYVLPIVISGILTTILSFFLCLKFSVIGVIVALGITGVFFSTWCFIIAKRLIAKPS